MNRDLDGDFGRRSDVRAPTDSGVLTLGVLSHNEEVDVATVPQRTVDPVPARDRPEVDVNVKRLPQCENQAPNGDVCGHVGSAHGPKEDSVMLPSKVRCIRGHGLSRLQPALTSPVELRDLDLNAVQRRGAHEQRYRYGHDLRSDAIAGDDRYAQQLTVSRVAHNATQTFFTWV